MGSRFLQTMKRLGQVIRNGFLGAATFCLFGGLVSFDHYLKNDPTRQAERFLEDHEMPATTGSAVEAAQKGDLFLLEQLRLAGADVAASDPATGLTPLHAAVRSDQTEAVDYLIGHDPVIGNLDAPAVDDGRTALGTALGRGDFGLASRLVELGAKADLDLEPGVPWLARATQEADWKTFGFLLAAGADPNRTEPSGLTPLAISVDRQDGERVGALVAAGARADVTGASGEPLLLEAIGRGDHDLSDTLLTAGAQANAVGVSGQTALLAAVRGGSAALVELLLSHGADPNLAGQDRQTPLAIAADSGDVGLMQTLIEAGADANEPQLIRSALERRDLPAFRLLLKAGADPNTTLKGRQSLLDGAIEVGSVTMARSLLEAGASPEGRLWAAFGSGDARLGELLLSHGASPSEIGPDGRQPMDFALAAGDGALVESLLEGGANPNGREPGGEYWVARAIREGNAGAALAMIDRGACLDGIKAADGHSLLGWAIARGMTEVVDRLIDQGADVRSREPAPASEAFTAAFTRSKTFRYHLQSDSGINPLMMAAAKGDHDTAARLIEMGARRGDHTRRYLWPVSIAAWHADVPMMQIVLGRDPDPDNQPRKIIIDLGSQRATLYESGRATYSTRVSTGKAGYRTPTGHFVITDKNRHHTSSIYHSSMPYFMRLSCAAFGLHQGALPGYPASHGCIRLPQSAASHLFSVCEVGDVVEIRH